MNFYIEPLDPIFINLQKLFASNVSIITAYVVDEVAITLGKLNLVEVPKE